MSATFAGRLAEQSFDGDAHDAVDVDQRPRPSLARLDRGRSRAWQDAPMSDQPDQPGTEDDEPQDDEPADPNDKQDPAREAQNVRATGTTTPPTS